jgi:hypothetical protein
LARPTGETSNRRESDWLLDTLAKWSDYLKVHVPTDQNSQRSWNHRDQHAPRRFRRCDESLGDSTRGTKRSSISTLHSAGSIDARERCRHHAHEHNDAGRDHLAMAAHERGWRAAAVVQAGVSETGLHGCLVAAAVPGVTSI